MEKFEKMVYAILSIIFIQNLLNFITYGHFFMALVSFMESNFIFLFEIIFFGLGIFTFYEMNNAKIFAKSAMLYFLIAFLLGIFFFIEKKPIENPLFLWIVAIWTILSFTSITLSAILFKREIKIEKRLPYSIALLIMIFGLAWSVAFPIINPCFF